jgi:hypothetical protein
MNLLQHEKFIILISADGHATGVRLQSERGTVIGTFWSALSSFASAATIYHRRFEFKAFLLLFS